MSFNVKEGKKGSGLAAKKEKQNHLFKICFDSLGTLENYLIGSVYLVNSSQKHSNVPLHVTG